MVDVFGTDFVIKSWVYRLIFYLGYYMKCFRSCFLSVNVMYMYSLY